jgi:hypothetical protein
MTKLKDRGGPGRDQGRHYDPYDRIRLAERYCDLKYEFTKAGVPKPGQCAVVMHLLSLPMEVEVELVDALASR